MSKILRKTRKPGIPRANTQDRNIKRTLDALTEGYEVGEGMRGNLLDAKVTWRDLQEAGIAQVQDMSIYYGGVGSGGGGVLVVNPSAPVPNMSVPPAPTGFKVNGGFSVAVLSWDSPFNQYNNHSHTEIWRSETDNFGQAVKIGTSQGVMFSDAIGDSASNYYWIRFVSTTDVQGPLNDTKGTLGKTAENPEYLMGVLSDEYGSESASPFFQLDEDTEIGGTLVPAGTYMKNAYVVNLTANNFVGKKIVADEAVVGISFSSPVITGGQITVANAGITDEGSVNIWAGASYAWRNSAPFKVYSDGLVDTSAITIRDAWGNVLLSSGTGMEWEYVAGAGKPADNATVGATFEPGHGQVQGQITPSNVSTYIANLAVGNAQIGHAAITTAKIGSAQVVTLHIGDEQVTTPRSITAASWERSSTASGWHTILTLSIPSTGRRMFVTAGLTWDRVVTAWESNVFAVRLIDVATGLVITQGGPVDVIHETDLSARPSTNYNLIGSAILNSGTRSIALQAELPSTPSDTRLYSWSASFPTIFALETKR